MSSKPCWVAVRTAWLPRGYAVRQVLDLSVPPPNGWSVYSYLDGKYLNCAWRIGHDLADEVFEAWALAPGPRGDSSWHAVLDRLRGVPQEPAGVWHGSIAEYASRYFAVGTWQWVQTLVMFRERAEKGKKAA
jgi:hypothetical protein